MYQYDLRFAGHSLAVVAIDSPPLRAGVILEQPTAVGFSANSGMPLRIRQM